MDMITLAMAKAYTDSVCLPVVELSTGFAVGASITGEDGKKLWEAYKKGLPTIIKCDITAGDMSCENSSMVWASTEISGDVKASAFVASVGGVMLMIMTLSSIEYSGYWTCMVQ